MRVGWGCGNGETGVSIGEESKGDLPVKRGGVVGGYGRCEERMGEREGLPVLNVL